MNDYCARGSELDGYNVLEFFVNTYEEEISTSVESMEIDESVEEMNVGRSTRRKGRPRHDRVSYQSNHPKYGHLQRVIRANGHNNLPNFIGQYFPRRNEPETYDFYCASMLMLLKPWRVLERDLKSCDQTWADAFDGFVESSEAKSRRIHDILAGIQYFHECESSASVDEDCKVISDEMSDDHGHHLENEDYGNDLIDEDVVNMTNDTSDEFTYEGLEELIASQTPMNEAIHAHFAVELARRAHVFTEDEQMWTVVGDIVSKATGDGMSRLLTWRNQLDLDVARQSHGLNCDLSSNNNEDDHGSVSRIGPKTLIDSKSNVIPLERNSFSESSLSSVDPSLLLSDQRRAYDIIAWHLEQTLQDKNPPPLRMILHGEGGTGKSKVIQTVSDVFKVCDVSHLLVKAAYTGVAASLIEGKTTHVIAGISLFKEDGRISDEMKAKLQHFWRSYKYLIIDEFSMISKTFLALLSRNIAIGKQGTREWVDSASFGGINVIICGDFHQFPPVARRLQDALYYPIEPIRDSVESQLGRAIYDEFTTVVILKQQIRVTDPVWLDFLRHLRHGQVQPHHLKMLRRLIIGNTEESNVDFTLDPWRNASLVTPRHAVRTHWNEAAIRKHCHEKKERLYVCFAEDTIGGRPLTLAEKYHLESRHVQKNGRRKSRRTKDLPRKIEIAIGMKVMVTDNIETDLDMTNGARGEIVDIILHPDEEISHLNDDASVVYLKHLPAYILVKLSRTRATTLMGLEEGVIPIEPVLTRYRIQTQTKSGDTVQKTVRRRQFPMTAAYAFTDYRSQGQTLWYVIVDIASPPTGTLTLFNLYVALSRSSGRDSIRLLRDFDDNLFKMGHDPALMEEDERLEGLNQTTQSWYERVIRK